MNRFAEHIKGQISKSAATVKELEELAKKYEEDLRGLGYTNMQVDPYFAYGQYGFYFNFMREDGKPGQKFTGLDTKNNTKLNLRNAYYDLINRKNWYLKRQANKCAKVTKKANIYDKIDDYLETINYFDRGLYSKGGIWVSFKDNTALNSFKKHLDELNIKYKEYTLGNDFYDDENGDRQVIYIKSEQWRDRESSKAKKMTKKAVSYEDEKAALAKFLKLNIEDLIDNAERYNLPSFKTNNGEEYLISANDEAIKYSVADSLEGLFDEIGLDEFKEKVLPYVGDMERYFYVTDDKLEEEAKYRLESDGIEEPTDEQIEKAKQDIIDDYGSAEEYFTKTFDTDYVRQMIKYGDASMDFLKMAEDVIDQYGAGHELSSYDNSTEEIEYNGKTYYIFRQARRNNKMNKKATKKLAEIINREINKSTNLTKKARETSKGYIVKLDDNIYLKYDNTDIDIAKSSYNDYTTNSIEEAKIYKTRREAEDRAYFADEGKIIEIGTPTQKMVNIALTDNIETAIYEINKEFTLPLSKEQLIKGLNVMLQEIDTFFD